MRVLDSAYAALGLRPGACRSDVDEAYRRLIKLHHPDRTGGDGNRAAEINRAYTFLRRDGLATGPRAQRMPVPVARPRRARSRAGWILAGIIGAAAIGGFATRDARSGFGRMTDRIAIRWPVDDSTAFQRLESPLTSFEEPLNGPVIDSAIAQAINFHSAGDSAGAGEFSRQCHVKLRQLPNLAWFDACSAFDEATVTLNGDDALAQSGPFDASAVAARETTAARAVSDDVIGADFRLHRIRSRVELQLLPKLDSAAGESP